MSEDNIKNLTQLKCRCRLHRCLATILARVGTKVLSFSPLNFEYLTALRSTKH